MKHYLYVSLSLTIYVPLSSFTLGAYVFLEHLFTFSVPFCHPYTWLLLGPCILESFSFNFSHQLRLFFVLISISTKALGKRNSSFFEHSIYSSFGVRHGHLRFCLSGCLRHTTLLLVCQVVGGEG